MCTFLKLQTFVIVLRLQGFAGTKAQIYYVLGGLHELFNFVLEVDRADVASKKCSFVLFNNSSFGVQRQGGG